MHKDQYTDAPSQEQVRVKTMLNAPFRWVTRML